MTWREDYTELLQLLDQITAKYPYRTFNVTSEKSSTPVRQLAFALENMIDQMKKPLVPDAQSLGKALIYKYNGPHRRQGFWRNYKHLIRFLRKYNDNDLLGRIIDLHKKATAVGAGFHMPTVETLRYIGGAYLKRVFRLQQIQELCIRTAHHTMGQIELGHWEKFSLFLVAICADINNGIRRQATSMEPVYADFSKFFKQCDDRFPDSLAKLNFFPTLAGRTSMKETVDTTRVMRLLQLSDKQLDVKVQMLRFRDEFSNVENADETIDWGENVVRNWDMDMNDSTSALEDTKDYCVGNGGKSSPVIQPFDVDMDGTEEVEGMSNKIRGSKNRRKQLKKKKKASEYRIDSSCMSGSLKSGSFLEEHSRRSSESPLKKISTVRVPLSGASFSCKKKKKRRNRNCSCFYVHRTKSTASHYITCKEAINAQGINSTTDNLTRSNQRGSPHSLPTKRN